MKTRVMVLYYSMLGNTYSMAQAVVSGIEKEGGAPVLRTVQELLPAGVIEGDDRIKKAKKLQKDVPVAKLEELEEIDGIIVGSPTRFGNMCSQLRNFFDATGNLWTKGSLVNKPAGFFCCTATMHGGQETTLISMMFTLMHHGAVIVGVPYSVKELMESKSGGTPYGPSAVVGTDASVPPNSTDLKIAEELGRRITVISKKLKGK
ncbi:MAG: NAD(P)H:quinone oxidoreductase [Candidatus Omnitrophica bacterium]|nr:NAD(P)H:quinone oxidoreductase [Candidatus Omnitrophota bacterium]